MASRAAYFSPSEAEILMEEVKDQIFKKVLCRPGMSRPDVVQGESQPGNIKSQAMRQLYAKHIRRKIQVADVDMEYKKKKMEDLALESEIKRRTMRKLDLEIKKLERELQEGDTSLKK